MAQPWRRWRSDAKGKERARWIQGRRERRRNRGREWGRVGGAIKEAGRGGLILPRRRRGGAAGTCPCSHPGRGNREGEVETERGGPGRLGLGVGPVGRGSSGGVPFPLFFCLFSLLYFLFFLFIFFSVLHYFKIVRHFLKICFLHNNYQCNIWHPPNIFV